MSFKIISVESPREVMPRLPEYALKRVCFIYDRSFTFCGENIKTKIMSTTKIPEEQALADFQHPDLKQLSWLSEAGESEPASVRIMYFVAEGLFAYSSGFFARYFPDNHFPRLYYDPKTTTFETENEIARQERVRNKSWRATLPSESVAFNIDATALRIDGRDAPSPTHAANIICICPCAHAEEEMRKSGKGDSDITFLEKFLPNFFDMASRKLITQGNLILVLKANDKYIHTGRLRISDWAGERGFVCTRIELLNLEQLQFESNGYYTHARSRRLGGHGTETTNEFVRFVFTKI